MTSFTVKDLSSKTKKVCDSAKFDNFVVITNNGIPTKMIIDIDGADPERQARILHQLRMMDVVERLRAESREIELSADEIEAEIAAFRDER
ncbi:MAG: hypothetical protein LBL67_02075 [Coriobacteriales bacterium]|jgi:hypothetical protein|nr:hypothetical protein [Coriobacteriales bacterium]